jgi:hypothetical protein
MPKQLSRTDCVEIPCKSCGRVRTYTVGEVRRGRASDLCQPCSVAAYNATRVKKTKAERAAKQAEWHQKNKDKQSAYCSDYRERLKLEAIEAYGGCCKHCGEKDPIVLVLDHVADDAKIDRAENNHSGGYKMYMRLRQMGWPQGRYQVLCHNCNFRKEYRRRKDAVKNRKTS